ncbi:hypothetical protein D0C36_15170 [Mucilaginibacter conchicola]|uniref:Uncharacterized protein n=1 Tax=Mucilaginibacter conchicola TaxID=2303333 RepID=A0A372NVS7_9SPHI|nr:hypothetical protein D0C36_15170 [Mucilaginibacter conchicola]
MLLFIVCENASAQSVVNLSKFDKSKGATVRVIGKQLSVSWPAGKDGSGKLVLDLQQGAPLFKSIVINKGTVSKEIAAGLDPAYTLTIGKRTLDPKSGGWDVFFDRVPLKPYKTYPVEFDKHSASVVSFGAHTIIRVSDMHASTFKGALEITLYNGSPLFNVAAVMATDNDSTAILYDAGLVSKKQVWQNVAWADVKNKLQTIKVEQNTAATNQEVKYRTIIGQGKQGSLALFPAPHQYFYPLDEAFNLKFTWHGQNYAGLMPGYGIGIRQDPLGDKRFVPWFNAPPKTQQRLNFFCLLSADAPAEALAEVKKFTHGDSYKPLPGYKTMASHFHNEFIMDVVLKGGPVPEQPEFKDVFEKTGLNIVHLAEFHGPGHPKGPDDERLKELHALHEQCERLSDNNFLLLPGEEPNNFYGGHWLSFFPHPVNWIMSRKADMPFVTDDPKYGKVYRIANKDEMLKLLELEHGLAWTAHARTKASTGYPDAYKEEAFYKSPTFMGAAWKAIPADLSNPTLSHRVLNLLDDMSNWGLKKHVIGESDIFTITEQNEMYAHLNVNYLQLDKIPNFKDGWQPVLDVMRQGKFFVSTGEVLLPAFAVNGKGAGETAKISPSGQTKITLTADWTFPLNFAEVVSGDGNKTYRERISLNNTQAFGKKQFEFSVDLKNRKWVRVELWDIAANGAFTQPVWLE